jgi:uncharacterized membrane protein YraQ (UPF0718 family)
MWQISCSKALRQPTHRITLTSAGGTMESLINGMTEAWWMLYHTFWALVFGFTLSGIVQAFVSRREMERTLGDDKAKTIAKASLFGIISSSCSYAASALAHSIFKKGANFTASMVFMFASTNLVIELGVVLWILMGWQFALAELIGGVIMIILLKLFLPKLVSTKLLSNQVVMLDQETANSNDPKPRFRDRDRWSDAAGYTVGDFTMLRKELIIGFVVAGFLATLIPISWWQSLFISDMGILSDIENAIIGPVLAFISFVCSVGNVPLAASLWHGGITFGGVVAFIFADLLALPLVLIYRRYYGLKLAVRMSLSFWLIISISGLITGWIFSALKMIPKNHHNMDHMAKFEWNYTAILNLIALTLLVCVFYLYKNRREVSLEFAKDFVCGMQVRIQDAPAKFEFEGKMYYFCMEGCKNTFSASPDKYLIA